MNKIFQGFLLLLLLGGMPRKGHQQNQTCLKIVL